MAREVHNSWNIPPLPRKLYRDSFLRNSVGTFYSLGRSHDVGQVAMQSINKTGCNMHCDNSIGPAIYADATRRRSDVVGSRPGSHHEDL
jgi:hypothetical protein